MIKEIVSIYKLLFYALTPVIVSVLPVVPYIITNNGAYMLALFLTLPLGAAIAMKFWDYSNLEDKQPTNQQPTEESKSIMSNRFKLDRFKFVNKDGISTDEMREMVDKYLVLNATEKDTIKQQLGCQSMNDLDFLTYILHTFVMESEALLEDKIAYIESL